LGLIAIISGDIINSQLWSEADDWLNPLKSALQSMGEEFYDWDIYWGDGFQVRLKNPEELASKYFLLHALLKKTSDLKVRIGIGLAPAEFEKPEIKFSNGKAYVLAAEALKSLKNSPVTTALIAANNAIHNELDVLFELASVIVDSWKPGTSAVVSCSLQNPSNSQTEIAEILDISQATVNRHLKRSNLQSLLKMESLVRNIILAAKN
jgi:hypothetical protein